VVASRLWVCAGARAVGCLVIFILFICLAVQSDHRLLILGGLSPLTALASTATPSSSLCLAPSLLTLTLPTSADAKTIARESGASSSSSSSSSSSIQLSLALRCAQDVKALQLRLGREVGELALSGCLPRVGRHFISASGPLASASHKDKAKFEQQFTRTWALALPGAVPWSPPTPLASAMTQENSDQKSAEKEKFSEALKDEEADEEEDEALAIALSMSRGDHNTSLLPTAGSASAAKALTPTPAPAACSDEYVAHSGVWLALPELKFESKSAHTPQSCHIDLGGERALAGVRLKALNGKWVTRFALLVCLPAIFFL
jgi:hypothetical protein